MRLSIFTGAGRKYILCWMNKFELIAVRDNWTEKTQGR